MTTAYLAGSDTNDLELSFAEEATWGTEITGAHYQKMRVQSESFAEQKNRVRPGEINSTLVASPATTQDQKAGGGVQLGVSYGNADSFSAGLVFGDWSDDLAITEASGDIDFVASGNHITSSTSTKFDDVVEGQWLDVRGCTTNGPRFFARVATKVDGGDLIVDGVTLVNETPASAAVTIHGSMLRNGTTFKSFTIQKRLASALGFTFPGTFMTGGQLNAARGQYFSQTFDAVSKSQNKHSAAIGTGFDAAPTNRVMDTVGNFKTVILDGTASTAKILSIATTMQRTGAALSYALGSAAAVGVASKGELDVSGTIEAFFADYSLFDDYAAETARRYSYRVQDVDGNAYVVTVPRVVLGQATIVAGGPNQAVTAKFPFMADPDPDLGMIQIDRFAATYA